ncbi:MAG: hypothetical protein R2857_04745 [Vampirovibrionales bacterium]
MSIFQGSAWQSRGLATGFLLDTLDKRGGIFAFLHLDFAAA